MRLLLRTLAGIVGLVLVLTGFVALLLGTEPGTRWLLGIGSSYVPGELDVDSVDGSLLGGVQLGGLHWQSGAQRATIRALRLEIDFLPLWSGHVAIRRLDVSESRIESGPSGRTEDSTAPMEIDVDLPVRVSIAEATIADLAFLAGGNERRIDGVTLAGTLDGSQLHVEKLKVESDWLDLSLGGNAELQRSMPFEIHASWRRNVSGEPPLAGDLRIRGDLRAFELEHELSAPVSIRSTGHVRLSATGPAFDIDSQWDSLEWPVGDSRVVATRGLLGVAGNLSAFDVELDTTAQLDPLPATEVSLSGRATLSAMRVDYLELVNELGRLTASGDSTWLPEPSVDLEFVLAEFDPSQFVADIDGSIGASGRLQASLAGTAPDASVDFDDVSGMLRQQPVAGSAQIRYRKDVLDIRRASLAVGSNSLQASGSLGKEIRFDADVDFPALAELEPALGGAVTARVSVSGPASRPRLEAEASGTKLMIGGTPADAVRFTLQGFTDEHSIDATVDAYRQQVDLSATGGTTASGWYGTIAALQVESDRAGTWSSTAPAAVSASDTGFELSRLCLVPACGAGEICATGDYDDNGLAAFTASVDAFPVSGLPLTLPRDVSLAGTIDATLVGQLADGDLQGDAAIKLVDGAVTGSYEGEKETVPLTGATARAKVIDNRLEATAEVQLGEGAAAARLGLSDVFSSAANIDGMASLSLPDVAFLAAFLPAINEPRGRINGELSVAGTLMAPEFAGAFVLEDGAFRVRPAGITVTDVHVRLQQREPASLQLEGRARSGPGTIELSGRTLVSSDSGIRTELGINGEDFEMLQLPDWSVLASPRLDMVFDEREIAVTGKLGIPQADVTVESIPETAQAPSPDAVVHREETTEPAAMRPISFDVTTTLGDEVRLSGFGLTTGLEGNLRLQGGTSNALLGFGRVQLNDGSYSAYGQDLTIERGELIWNGPLDNPSLDIRATRDAGEVIAGIHLTGTPTQLRSEMFSEPPLSDADILAYLLTGRPLSGATTAGEGDTLNQAAFALGLSQAGAVVSQIGGALGLETLTVEGGGDSGRIVAGKRIGDQLLVEYGYGLVDGLGTLLLRYQLNDRLVLESRTGTVSNLDIVYSVRKQ